MEKKKYVVTEEDMKMLRWGRINGEWIKENHDELKQMYPDTWIALHDGIVLASSKDFDDVLEAVRTKHKDIEKYLNIEQIKTKPLFEIASFTLRS